MRYTTEERESRYTTILRLRDEEGFTFAEVGKAISVTAARACCLYDDAKRWLERQGGEDRDLSTRARHGLHNMMRRVTGDWWYNQPVTKQMVIDNQDRLRETRNIGKVTEDELRSWAGLPPIVTGPRGGFCPHCGEAI